MKHQIEPFLGSPDDNPEPRFQVAALCWRKRRDGPEVLMITSRRTRRWILPKGWPIDGETPHRAAEIEAFEEAGVIGSASDQSVGVFSYLKVRRRETLPCVVTVFPMRVQRVVEAWPERARRARRWTTIPEAIALVSDAELRPILRAFRPCCVGRQSVQLARPTDAVT